jgi:2-polyprenyl-3-methyl-5-hydroxy-6-metoxy-1,4-benzoquinol methylase
MADDKKCRACGNFFTDKSLLRLPGMPGAVQNLPADRDEAIMSGVVLDVRQCSFCGLVQLSNDPVPYYKDVIRAGSFSPSMRARQHNEFKIFIERFSLMGKNILEIGSGGGEYLSILNEFPVNAFGMEHNPDLNKIANEKGLKTFQAYPTDLTEPLEGIMFDAVISINFLEHAPEPGAFLRAAAKLLSENGVGMIGVPDFEFELQDNYLFSFMSDHLLYFSSDSLRNVLTLNGFHVLDVFRNKKLNVVTAYFKKREQWNLVGPMEEFDNFNKAVNDYMDSILNKGGRIVLWGASHLAFSIVSASKTENKISYIVDSAPFKQGRFSPASGLEIFSPEHLLEDPVDTIIVMSPEYSEEIVEIIKEKFSNFIHHIATFKNGGLAIVQ